MAKARRLLVAFYLTVAAVGAVIPYAILIPAVRADGIDLGTFGRGLFANPAASIFSSDVLLASLVFVALAVVEGRRADMRHLWLYPLAVLAFGLSCAMPLFLAMRERALTDRA